MADPTYDLLIIGGGPAGVTGALRARELGATVALIEAGTLGGTCTNDGCVPTRFLAHAARLVRNAAEYADYGLEGSAPRANLPLVLSQARSMVERIHAKKQIRKHLETAGVDVADQVGPATFVDPYSLTVASGPVYHGSKILIAAGGHARRLPIPGGELALTHSDVWTMDTAFGQRTVPETLLVIGGAATGCQLASVFAAFGSAVTLVDTAPRLTPSEDADVSLELGRAFASRGIHVILESSVIAITLSAGDRRRVDLSTAVVPGGNLASSTPGGSLAEEFDVVIAAVGWPGNVDSLNLAAAGVATDRGYIVVDQSLRTSQPHIYAAGDITGRMMLVQAAGYEGLAAVENALHGTARSPRHLVVPHGGFTDPEYGSVGLTESQAANSGDVVAAKVPYSDIDRAVIDGRPDGFCKLIVDRPSRRIVGAHVVGQQAVEIIQVAATAMKANAVIDDVARLEYAYPTFTSAIGLAARKAQRMLSLPDTSLTSAGDIYGAEWEPGTSA